MNFSINDSVDFSNIDWGSLESRPSITTAMPFCRENEWDIAAKCCMNGYTIEHVRDMAYDNGYENTLAANFLDQYPCLNGIELDGFVEQFNVTPASKIADKRSVSEWMSKVESFISQLFSR